LHFLFVTKYRKKVINLPILERIREIFASVCIKTNCILLEFSAESDHVHLLVDFHPDNNISDFTSSLKSASSRIIRKEFNEHVDKFYYKPLFWSSSYYVASSGGAPIEKLKQYIKEEDAPTK
jgi:putative transposase